VDKIELRTIEIKINRENKELRFKIKELNADDFWSIQDQCIDKKSEIGALDTHQMNLLLIVKSVTDPSMTMEQAANLPKQISERLTLEIRKLNAVEETFLEVLPTPQKIES